MPIDSAEKRKAAGAAFALYRQAPGVPPNAAPDQEWRQESLWSYPGILAASSVAGPPAGSLLLLGVGI